MSLFVGNLSQNVKYEQLKDAFEPMGKCRIQLKVRITNNTTINANTTWDPNLKFPLIWHLIWNTILSFHALLGNSKVFWVHIWYVSYRTNENQFSKSSNPFSLARSNSCLMKTSVVTRSHHMRLHSWCIHLHHILIEYQIHPPFPPLTLHLFHWQNFPFEFSIPLTNQPPKPYFIPYRKSTPSLSMITMLTQREPWKISPIKTWEAFRLTYVSVFIFYNSPA